MRRARVLLWMLAFVSTSAAPAYATSVTVSLTGEWYQVTDNGNVTDGSITNGGAFTVTLTFDDATPDIDPDPSFGGYLFPTASSALTLSTGSYTFTLAPAAGNQLSATQAMVFGIGDDLNGQDDFGWFAEEFTTSGPLPPGVTTGYGYMNPQVVDSTQTAHTSDALADLPWSIAAYDSPNLGMYFLIAVNGAGSNKFIELFGDFTELSVLPEPSLFALAGIALVSLLAAKRRV